MPNSCVALEYAARWRMTPSPKLGGRSGVNFAGLDWLEALKSVTIMVAAEEPCHIAEHLERFAP